MEEAEVAAPHLETEEHVAMGGPVPHPMAQIPWAMRMVVVAAVVVGQCLPLAKR